MPIPTPKSAHVDSALTGLSIAYRNGLYIADQVFPTVPVKKQSDYYFVFRRGDWFRLDADVRGPGASSREIGYKLTSAAYACVEYAGKHLVPIELLNNADDVLRPLGTGVEFVSNAVMLKKERIVSTLITTAANWNASEDANGLWAATDSTNTFFTDVNLRRETIRQAIGMYPNTLIIDAKTFSAMKESSILLDRIKYTGTEGKPANVTPQMIAALTEVDRVLIGGAIYSSDEETAAGTEFTAVDLWETNAGKGAAWLGYVSPVAAVDVPSSGYTFTWNNTNVPDEIVAQNGARAVRRWWDSDRKGWFLEGFEAFDSQITSNISGFLWTDTYAT